MTIRQIRSGAEQYIEQEILPHLDTAKRIGASIYAELAFQQIEAKAMDYLNLPAVRVLGISDGNGNVDLERLHDAAVNRMTERFDVDVPVLGRFTFNRNDVEKLCDLIRRS